MTKVTKATDKPTDDEELELQDNIVGETEQEEKPVVADETETEAEDETEETETPEVLDTETEEESEEETEDEEETLEVKAVYDAKTKVAVASTDVVDRHGERINQEGWDLKFFKKNPVMLWAHDHAEIAVGNARNIHIERSGGTPRLVFTPDFHDATDKARALKTLYEDGRLNSFSVGFIPKDFDGKDSTYLKQELLEISAVNVPANPEARMLAFKSLKKAGFKKDVIKEITDLDAETTITEEPEEKQKLSDVFKGALADEIAENEMMKQKYENMSKFHDLSWAFCDVYYDAETPVEDFDTLLAEYVVEIGKLIDGTSPISSEDDTEPVEEQVLDKDSNKSETDNKTAKTQDNTETSVAPKKERAKQSLSKVIAKASEKLLEGEKHGNSSTDRTEMIKVIKRAAEILNASHKSK